VDGTQGRKIAQNLGAAMKVRKHSGATGVGNRRIIIGVKITDMIFLLVSSFLLANASTVTAADTLPDTTASLLRAMRIVESGGNDDGAVGDGGMAIGAYQIWKVYWKDALEYDPSIGGVYKDCFNRAYSERVIRAYWARYATKKRLGRIPTLEDRARIHNGGPNALKATGNKKKNLDRYWHKVKKELLSLSDD